MVQLAAGAQSCLSGNAGPRAFCSLAYNLLIARILLRCLPGEMVRDADKGVKDYVDGFEVTAVRVRKGRIIGRVDVAVVLHADRITKSYPKNIPAMEAE